MSKVDFFPKRLPYGSKESPWPDAALYATPGDGTATPVTPEMLAAAIDDALGQYPGSTSASLAGMIIKRVLEAKHG